MRIAIIFPPTSGHGGIETATANLVEGLKGSGEDVKLFALSESVKDGSWHRDLPWIQIGSARQDKLSTKQALLLAFLLGREIKRYRPHVVVTLTAFSIPIVRLAFLFAWFRVPIVSWLHFTLKNIGRKRFLSFADGHIAISGKGAEELKSYLGSGHSVFTVPNGTRLEVTPIPRPTDSEMVKFVYVGRLQMNDQKRVNDILTAASSLHGNFQITFVGTGDDLGSLQEMSNDLGLATKVLWLGWQSDPWSAVGKAHALLLTSSFEGCPMVLIEAMVRGLPCVSADCETGPSDMITPGRSGWLFPVADVAALTAVMQRIVDDRLILPTSEAVIGSVRSYGIENVAKAFRGALHKIIQRQDRNARHSRRFDLSQGGDSPSNAQAQNLQ